MRWFSLEKVNFVIAGLCDYNYEVLYIFECSSSAPDVYQFTGFCSGFFHDAPVCGYILDVFYFAVYSYLSELVLLPVSRSYMAACCYFFFFIFFLRRPDLKWLLAIVKLFSDANFHRRLSILEL